MNCVIFRKLKPEDRKIARGFRLFECPAIETKPLPTVAPKKNFDYLLLTSSRALSGVRGKIHAKEVVSIGEATSKAATSYKRIHRLQNSNSAGVLAFFKKAPRGSIFFPRSNRGDVKLPRDLRKLGFSVQVRHSYETKLLPIRKKLSQILGKVSADGFLVTSPSVVKALRKSFRLSELRSFQGRWVAIGPTTAVALRRLGVRFRVAKSPSIAAMIRGI